MATGCAGARTVPDVRETGRERTTCWVIKSSVASRLLIPALPHKGGMKIVYRSQVSIMTVPANPTLSVVGKHVTCGLNEPPPTIPLLRPFCSKDLSCLLDSGLPHLYVSREGYLHIIQKGQYWTLHSFIYQQASGCHLPRAQP